MTSKVETKEVKPVHVRIKGIGREQTISGLKCGQCKFFKQFGFYSISGDSQKREKVPCNELGILETSLPCPNFSISPYKINFKNKEGVERLLEKILQKITKKDLALFSVLINQEQRTRKKGFYFGQIVYLRLFGEDYLSNYVKAKIINATGEYVHVQGDKGFNATLFIDSILTKEAFIKKQVELTKKNKLLDPNFAKHTKFDSKKLKLFKADYKPNTIDKFLTQEETKRSNIPSVKELFDENKVKGKYSSRRGNSKVFSVR